MRRPLVRTRGINAEEIFSEGKHIASELLSPVGTLLLHILYRDVGAAILWLTRVFRFNEDYRYGKPMDRWAEWGRVGSN